MFEKDEQDALKEIENEIAELFKDEQDSSPVEPEPKPAETKEEKKDETKAFSIRLNEEREKIAKQAGFSSYEEMLKKNEQKKIEDTGLDPEIASPLIEKLVNERIENDPRLKELETYKKQEKDRQFKEWCEQELKSLTKLTDGQIKSMNDVPADVIKLSEKTGSLKSAYMQLHGEALVNQIKAKQIAKDSKGTTDHLVQPVGAGAQVGQTRPLTEAERKAYRMINRSITDAELDKIVKSV